jgi:hypothetical protein
MSEAAVAPARRETDQAAAMAELRRTMVDRQLMRDFAVGGRLRQLIESPDFQWARGVGLALVHAAAFLAAACVVFTRRDP